MSCPICGQDMQKAYRPFCSKRCADLDLANWFNGNYAVPSVEPETPEEPVAGPDERPARPH
ncbi:MAG: DNA gyrase inhibitor YacG [Paracoccaceae bacterium]